MDTIYAVSTARGKAGVAVIRVSGPDVEHVANAVCGGVPSPRKATLRVLQNNEGERLDEALVIHFPGTASFTGEPVIEFQVHGSVAVVSAVLDCLNRFDGLRAAEPGEFTRRALANERLDLTQVEALADLIDSETESQRRQAMRVLSGDLGRKAGKWRQSLIRATALLEATIDFADEDIPEDVSADVLALVDQVIHDLSIQIAGVGGAERIRDGFEVAIVGPPNIGKSTLLNVLAGRDAAITSEHAGTTRDVIEVRMDLHGLPVTLLDTAGLRATEDAVESIGISRARDRASAADLRVFLTFDGVAPVDLYRDEDIILRGKGDLLGGVGQSISGLTGHGVDALVQQIGALLENRAAGAGIAIRARHEDAMRRGASSLQRVRQMVSEADPDIDLVAEELHTAIRALDSLVGQIDIESVLDEIFASFCLGK
ncbi:MAG: tRNA uridine-5-carboxymethylaminomethyl(34) synthesis GTPase MnmE [Roseovarius sp.]|jgi:tRNA modification GTPase|uniref:tRNA uridine-5-carboxymethylaminomethyl(34) synthesis GTPase MnmE n=1 Tax=Roseovarius sp. TaxID=1486281 RepID=UPI0032EF3D4F